MKINSQLFGALKVIFINNIAKAGTELHLIFWLKNFLGFFRQFNLIFKVPGFVIISDLRVLCDQFTSY
jgi:hypothetical protein